MIVSELKSCRRGIKKSIYRDQLGLGVQLYLTNFCKSSNGEGSPSRQATKRRTHPFTCNHISYLIRLSGKAPDAIAEEISRPK